MPKYAVLFSLDSNALARFIENPSDRRGPVQKAAEAAGGKLDAYYWMFGQYDGMAIFDLPNSNAAAALALAVSSSGALKHLETHELIEPDNLVAILERAKKVTASYQPPGGRAR